MYFYLDVSLQHQTLLNFWPKHPYVSLKTPESSSVVPSFCCPYFWRCTRKWLFKFPLCAKPLLHWGHLKGFSPVWILSWILSADEVDNILLQNLQVTFAKSTPYLFCLADSVGFKMECSGRNTERQEQGCINKGFRLTILFFN